MTYFLFKRISNKEKLYATRFEVCLSYTPRKVELNWEGLKSNGTH